MIQCCNCRRRFYTRCRFRQAFLFLLLQHYISFGKTFFWPTMLAVVSEQFPEGNGALTLNAIGSVRMLSAGSVGTIFLGMIQDYIVTKALTMLIEPADRTESC